MSFCFRMLKLCVVAGSHIVLRLIRVHVRGKSRVLNVYWL